MSQDPSPAARQDGVPWPEDDWDPGASLDSLVAAVYAGEYEVPPEGPDGASEQGLFVCLAPGQVALEGFVQHGAADTMEPGALLAAAVETVTGDNGAGLARLSENQHHLHDTLRFSAQATLTVQSPTRATTSTVPPRAST